MRRNCYSPGSFCPCYVRFLCQVAVENDRVLARLPAVRDELFHNFMLRLPNWGQICLRANIGYRYIPVSFCASFHEHQSF